MREDMKIFKALTTEGERPGVIMGRKTWESLPKVHRPLCDRINIILTTTMDEGGEGVYVTDTVEGVLEIAKRLKITTLWVIGGERVYRDFMGVATEIVITRIDHTFIDCDARFPHDDLEQFYTMTSENKFSTDNYNFMLQVWNWTNHCSVNTKNVTIREKTTTSNCIHHPTPK